MCLCFVFALTVDVMWLAIWNAHTNFPIVIDYNLKLKLKQPLPSCFLSECLSTATEMQLEHAHEYMQHTQAYTQSNRLKNKVNNRTHKATFTVKNGINFENWELQVGFRPHWLSARWDCPLMNESENKRRSLPLFTVAHKWHKHLESFTWNSPLFFLI